MNIKPSSPYVLYGYPKFEKQPIKKVTCNTIEEILEKITEFKASGYNVRSYYLKGGKGGRKSKNLVKS